ncbi:unnamed protein product, partial [Musa textilis]
MLLCNSLHKGGGHRLCSPTSRSGYRLQLPRTCSDRCHVKGNGQLSGCYCLARTSGRNPFRLLPCVHRQLSPYASVV